jgi:hypothetical protein
VGLLLQRQELRVGLKEMDSAGHAVSSECVGGGVGSPIDSRSNLIVGTVNAMMQGEDELARFWKVTERFGSVAFMGRGFPAYRKLF